MESLQFTREELQAALDAGQIGSMACVAAQLIVPTPKVIQWLGGDDKALDQRGANPSLTQIIEGCAE